MTRAAQQGRNLALFVEDIDEPFIVRPLPAKRGRALTETFAGIALGVDETQQPAAVSEAVFIEAINPDNYARMAGGYVDEFDSTGRYVTTWSTTGSTRHERLAELTAPARFIAREANPDLGEPEVDGEPIRQEEAESLSLCAFYWQSVVGMEAVEAFLEGGEGTAGSLKALRLLLIRIGRSPSTSSYEAGMASLTQQADSEETTDTANSSGSVPLPANKRGFLPPRNAPRRRAKTRRN